MIQRYVVPLGLVVSASLAVLTATGQDRGGRDTARTDAGVGRASTFTGRIGRIDAAERTIELKDFRSVGGAVTNGTQSKLSRDSGNPAIRNAGSRGAIDTGGVGGEDNPRPDRNVRDATASGRGPIDTGGVGGDEFPQRDTKGKGSAGAGTRPRDRSTGTADTMVFRLTVGTRITLDGKPATLRDLKSANYARVHAVRGVAGDRNENAGVRDSGTGTRDSGRSATKGSITGGSRSGAAVSADRVEAFTRDPDLGRPGGASGTKAGVRGKDRSSP